MQLRTYRAPTMAEALTAVKKDLGKDAVILHTRSYKSGGLFGLGARSIIEITASDAAAAPPRQRRAAAPAHIAPAPMVAARAYAASAGPSAAHNAPTPQSPPPAAEREEFLSRPRAAAPKLDSVRIEAVQMPVHRTGSRPDAALRPSIEEELGAIKLMVGQVLQTARLASLGGGRDEGGLALAAPPAIGRMPDALCKHYLAMVQGDVAADIADEVIGAVRDELTPAELSDDGIVRETVLRHLAEMIPVAGDVARPRTSPDGRPLTIALVGPTGVGKTTTVAKLAAAYKLRHGRRVGLITTDTYRIAAVDQLRMYANIIGLPLKVVLTPADMAAACEALADCDVVLIDTAGRSPRDSGRLDELRQFIAAAEPHETHLVLSSTGSERALVESAQRFSVVRPDRLILTKLDEAVNFGVLVGVARKVELRLSYLTTGQEVPDQIEVGRADRLARLVLDGGRTR